MLAGVRDAGDHVRRAGRVLVAAGVAVQDRDRLVLEDDRSLFRQALERLRVRVLEGLAAGALEVQVDLDDSRAVLGAGIGGRGQRGHVRVLVLALRQHGLQALVLTGAERHGAGHHAHRRGCGAR